MSPSDADRGTGIDELEQTLIFDKFFRGRNNRHSVQGTGMGLAIAKAVVELTADYSSDQPARARVGLLI